MYRVIKSKSPASYAVHRVIKVEDGETYIDSTPVVKASSKEDLYALLVAISEAYDDEHLDKGNVITIHKTMWNENDIPFFEDVSEDLLEAEFSEEELEDYAVLMDQKY